MIRKMLLSAAALAAILPGVASAAWYQASSKHFVVYSNDKPENVKAYTEKLERFDRAISAWHRSPPTNRGPASRVTIFVVNDVAEVQRVYGAPGPAGFYLSRASGSVAFMPRSGGDGELSSQAILFHEYTHHWMYLHWSDAAFPYWFTEGFAELHATAIMRPDGGVTFGAAPAYRRYTVGQSNLMPAGDLLRARPSDKLDGASRDAVYSRGWLLLDYLTFDDERRIQLAQYIAAVNSGKTIAESAKLFGNTDTLDSRMTNWGKRPRLMSASIAPSEIAPGPIDIRALTAGESAIMPALILSRRGVDPKRAAEVVAQARRLAAPYPDDAGAQNELAEAEYDAGNFALSEAAADRARAADPKSIHALLYKGMAMQAQAKKDKVTDPARWLGIRKWYLAANKLDTEDPEPLVQFYDSFGAANEKPTGNAESALIYAYMLAPYDGPLRVRATRVFLGQGKVPEARIALGPIAFSAESRNLAAIGPKVMDAIDKNDIAEAIRLLDTANLDDAKDGDDKKKDGGSKKKG